MRKSPRGFRFINEFEVEVCGGMRHRRLFKGGLDGQTMLYVDQVPSESGPGFEVLVHAEKTMGRARTVGLYPNTTQAFQAIEKTSWL